MSMKDERKRIKKTRERSVTTSYLFLLVKYNLVITLVVDNIAYNCLPY